MKVVKHILGVILLVGLCSYDASAETVEAAEPPQGNELGNPIIKHYTTADHSGSQLWCIAQDARGVMYFGDNNNILEFDGYTWNQIPIPTSPVRSMAQGKDGVIYVGISNDLGYLTHDGKGNTEYASLLSEMSEKNREFGDVWSTVATSHGIYFFTDNKTFRWWKNSFEVIEMSIYMAFGVGDHIYVIGWSKGVSILQGGKLTPIPYFEKFERGLHFGRMRIMPFKGNRALITTNKQGIFVHDLGRFLEEQQSKGTNGSSASFVTKFPTEADDFIREHTVQNTSKIDDERYALATMNAGLLIFDDQGKIVRSVSRNQGLGSNEALSLYVDKAANLWVGLNNGNIDYVSLSLPISVFDEKAGLGTPVAAFLRHKQTVYLGTTTGIMYLPPPNTTTGNHDRKLKRVEGTNTQSFGLIEFRGSLLAAHDKTVIQIMDNKATTLTTFDEIAASLGHSKRFEDIVFVGVNGGMYMIEIDTEDSETGALSAKVIENDTLKKAAETFYEIRTDNNGDLWANGVSNGLFHIKWNSDVLEDFEVIHYSTEDGLPEMAYNKAYFLGDQLFVTTKKGLYKSELSGDRDVSRDRLRFVPETTLGKIFIENPEFLHGLYRDGNGEIWLSGVNHFGRLLNEDGIFNWDTRLLDILPVGVGITHMDGDLFWIASGESIYRYDTSMEKDLKVDFNVLLRDITVNSNGTLIAQAFKDKPTLSYDSNEISFEFTAVFFEKPKDTKFSFKLDGFDKNWSNWTTERKTKYTNLPEGKYSFQVKAKNVYSHESRTATFEFSILPPWYRTIWAYVGYLLGFALLLFVSITLNSRRLVIAKRRLQKIVKKRTAEVVKQRDEIKVQKDQIEEAKNALWGEMELAKKIQTVLLPKEPQMPGFEITGYMETADEVGGDYYDVVNAKGKDWIVIGDVSGHGVPAGLVMMMVQTAINQVLLGPVSESPDMILTRVNKNIFRNIEKLGENKYMTLTLMSVESDGTIYFSGLHQDIMVYRKATNVVELIETQGMWLGMIDDIEGMNSVDELHLEIGDVMLLYTDGIVEATDKDGKLYKDELLIEVFEASGEQSTTEIRDHIIKSLSGYTTKDDVTMLVVKRNGT